MSLSQMGRRVARDGRAEEAPNASIVRRVEQLEQLYKDERAARNALEGVCRESVAELARRVDERLSKVSHNAQAAAGVHRQLADEQQDHAEAINNLIQMLEKTATQEDVARAAEAAAMDANDLIQKIGAAGDRALSVETQLEMSSREMSSRIEGQLGSLSDRLESDIDSLRAETTAELLRMDRRGQDSSAALSTVVTQVSSEVADYSHTLNQRFDQLEEAVGTAEAAKAQREMLQKLGRTVLSLEAKLDSTALVLHQKVELLAAEVDRQLEAAAASIDSKLSQAERNASARFDAAATELRSDFNQEKGGLDVELQTLKDHIERQEKRMQASIRDDVKVLQTRLNNDVAAVKSAMEDRMMLVSSRVDRQLDSTSAQIKDSNDRVAEMAVRVTQLSQEMGDRMVDASTRLEEFRKLASDQIVECRQQSAAIRVELESGWESALKRERDATQNALKQNESSCSAEAKQLRAQQELYRNEARDLSAEVRREMTATYSSLESVSAEQQTYFNGQLATIQSRFNEKEAVLRGLVDDLTGTMVNNYRAIATTQSASDAELASRIREHEIILDRTRTQLTEMCGRLDLRLSEQKQHADESIRDRTQELAERIQEVRSYANDRCSEMDLKVEHSTKDSEDRLTQKQTIQLSRVDELEADVLSCKQQCSTIVTDIDSLSKAAVDGKELCLQVGSTAEKHLDQLRTSIDSKVEDLQDKVRQDSARFTTFAAAQTAKQSGLDSKLAGTAQTVADQREKFVALCQNLENEQRADHRLSMDSLRQVQSTLAEIRTELESKMQGHYQHFTDLHINLDHRFQEKFASQEMRVIDQHQSVIDSIVAIELQAKQKSNEHDQRFRDYGLALADKSTDFSDTCIRIEKQSVDRENRAVDLITGLATTLQENKQEMIDLCAVIEKGAMEATALGENQLGEQLQIARQQISKLQRNVDQIDERHTESANNLQNQIDEAQQQSASAIADLDSRVSSQIKDVDMGLHMKVENLRSEIDRQYQKTVSLCGSLEKKFATRTSMLHEKFGVVEELANAVQQQVADDRLDIDTKFSARCNKVEERISLQAASLTDLVKQLENSLRQKDVAFETALRGQYDHFTDAVAGLHDFLVQTNLDVEERQAATNKNVADSHESSNHACDKILEMVKDSNKTRDARVQALISTLEIRTQALEAGIERKGSELADADERLQARMDASLVEIHRKTQKLETCDSSLALALDSQVATLRQCMDDEAEQWRRSLALLGRQVADEKGSLEQLAAAVNGQVCAKLTKIDTSMVTREELTTKLRLVAFDMDECKDAVVSLGATLNEQDSQMEQQEDAISTVRNEMRELAVELSTVEMAVQMG